MDFIDVVLSEPATGTGDCSATDMLVAAGGADTASADCSTTTKCANPPRLCGGLTGQHSEYDKFNIFFVCMLCELLLVHCCIVIHCCVHCNTVSMTNSLIEYLLLV